MKFVLRTKPFNSNSLWNIKFKLFHSTIFLRSKTHYGTINLLTKDILGAKPKASIDEVKKCYLNQVKYWHPDLNPSLEAKERFNSIKK